MADSTPPYYISLGKDGRSGTLFTLSFPEHELLLKYEIINKETKKSSPLTEKVDSSPAEPQHLEQQESVTKIVELQPEVHPQNKSLPPSDLSEANTSIKLLRQKGKKPYRHLIELILRIPGMKQYPHVRYSLLPKNLRIRPNRSEQDAVKDLEYIIDWAERNNALPKVFSNLWIKLNENVPEDDDEERKKLREECNEIRNEFDFPKRKIRLEQGQIPIECRSFLRNELNARFNLTGIRSICYDLGIDFEALEGPEKPGKIISLLEAVEHQHRVNDLITICKSERPYGNWDC